jgi:hypothetical protein
MAKYMLIMRETDQSRAASANLDFDEMVNVMGAYMTETDWPQIVLLYEALGRLTPSPVVELAHAAELCTNAVERGELERKIREITATEHHPSNNDETPRPSKEFTHG